MSSERDGLATERILDAAAEAFAARGVSRTGMADVAALAGCSRATLYRYFTNRRQLHLAFMVREATRLADRVAVEVADIEDPRERLVSALMATVRGFRTTPGLAVWGVSSAAFSAERAQEAAAFEELVARFLGDPTDADVVAQARWGVRLIASLLTIPGVDEAEEREMVERFAIPPVLPPS